MTIFSNLAASARAAHRAMFGGRVLLSEPGQPDRKVTVVLGNVTTEDRREDGRDLRVSVRECRFVTLAFVRHDAIVTIDNVQWSIDAELSRQASGLTVKLRRRSVSDVNRNGYRGKG